MKNKQDKDRRSRSRRPPLAAIALLMGFLALVLVLVTLRHQKAGRNHRLRLLAGFGERVEEIVPERADRFVSILREQAGQEEVERYLAEVTSFEVLGVLPSNYSHSYRGDPKLELEPRGSEIYLTYQGPLYRGSRGSSRSLDASGSVTARIDLAAVLEPVITPEVFDAILIADHRGRVLFQQGEREIRMASLAGLLAQIDPPPGDQDGGSGGDDGDPRSGALEHGFRSAAFEHKLGGTHYEVFLQPIAIRLPAVGGHKPDEPVHWVACGLIGRDRLLSSSFTTSPVMLFLLVALFPAALVAWPFLKLWLISPRERYSRFDVVSLVFAGLLGTSLVTLTFADFLFISRIKTTIDGQLTRLSDGLRASLRDEIFHAHDQLELLKVHDREVAEARTKIDRRSRDNGDRRGTEWLELLHEELGTRRDRPTYPYFHSIAWIDAEGDQRVKLPMVPSAVPTNKVEQREYFRSIAVELRSVPRRGRVRFPDRSAHRFRLESGDEGRPPIELCLQPIRSLTTGEDLLVLAVQGPDGLDEDKPIHDDDLLVTALVIRPLSLAHPLLPGGFGFALLDQSGRVLFHSDSRRSQNENFLKSSDRRSLLAALLRERRSASFDLTYWGRRHRAHVAPVEDLPWSLVTFRDMRDLRSRNFELVYDFLNVYVPYALLLGVLAAFLIALPRRFGRYLWPGAAFAPAYGWTLGLGVLVTLAFALILQFGSRDAVFWSSWALPLLMLVVTGLVLRCGWCRPSEPEESGTARGAGDSPPGVHDEPEAGRRVAPWLGLIAVAALAAILWARPPRLIPCFLLVAAAVGFAVRIWRRQNFLGRQRRIGYNLALATVFFVVAVLPALGIFQLASGRQAQFLVQDSQVAMVDAIESRRDALRDFRWLGRYYDDYEGRLREFERRYLASFETVVADGMDGHGRPDWPYPCTERHVAATDGATARSGGLVPRWMAARLVALNDLSAQPVAVDLSRYTRHGCRWSLTGADGGDDRRMVGHFDSLWEEEGLALSTQRIPPLEGWRDLSWPRRLALVAGVVAVILLPWWVARFIARQALLITLVQTGKLGTVHAILTAVEPGTGSNTMLVTSVPDLAVRKLPKRGGPFRRVRFTELVAAAKKGQAPTFDDGEIVLVVGFKPELQEVVEAEFQVAALQALTESEKLSVVLVSRISTTTIQERLIEADERTETPNPLLIRRWAAYLATFVMRYGRDEGEPEKFDGLVRVQRARAHTRAERFPDGARDRRAQFERSLLDLIVDECRLTRQLQEVGRQIFTDMRDGDYLAATEEQVLGQISFLARPYYQAIWAGCSTDEKVVLAQLALDGLVNPKNRVWALDLMQKGLICRDELPPEAGDRPPSGTPPSEPASRVRRFVARLSATAPAKWLGSRLERWGVRVPRSSPPDPSLRLLNRSFADFVRQVVDRTHLLQWEDEKGTSTWSILKWLLPLPLLLLGAFLFLTQRDAVSNAVGALVALASLVPTLLNIYGHFREVTDRRDRDLTPTT